LYELISLLSQGLPVDNLISRLARLDYRFDARGKEGMFRIDWIEVYGEAVTREKERSRLQHLILKTITWIFYQSLS
jgi:hypothetical protein